MNAITTLNGVYLLFGDVGDRDYYLGGGRLIRVSNNFYE